jgi:hypothetical protein
MSEVSEVNGVEIADIEAINGVDGEDIESINGVDFVTGFSNNYSLAMGNIQTGAPSLDARTHMQVANPTSYNFHDSGAGEDEPFSVSMWFKCPSTTDTPAGVGMSNSYVISKGTSGATEWQVHFHGGTHVLLFKLEDSSGNQMYTFDGSQSWTSLQSDWHHLVVIYAGGPYSNNTERQTLIQSMYYFIDGAAYQGQLWAGGAPYSPGGTVPWAGLRTSTNPVKVGSSISGPGQTVIGYMDEVSVWSKWLSGADVTSIYNSGTPTDLSEHASVANLLSWWRMGDNNSGTGTTVTDAQGTGNGTLCTTLACGTPGVFGADGFVTVVP